MSDRLGMAVAITMAAFAICLTGCERRLARAEFIKAYEERNSVSTNAGTFRFVMSYLGPEYLAAQSASDSVRAGELDSLLGQYGNAYYLRLSIRMPIASEVQDSVTHPLRTDPSHQQALLGQKLKDERWRLDEAVYLRTPDGEKVPPISVSLNTGHFTGSVNTFLFLFPTRHAGRDLSPSDCEFVIEDIGLGTGPYRARIKVPKRIYLKFTPNNA